MSLCLLFVCLLARERCSKWLCAGTPSFCWTRPISFSSAVRSMILRFADCHVPSSIIFVPSNLLSFSQCYFMLISSFSCYFLFFPFCLVLFCSFSRISARVIVSSFRGYFNANFLSFFVSALLAVALNSSTHQPTTAQRAGRHLSASPGVPHRRAVPHLQPRQGRSTLLFVYVCRCVCMDVCMDVRMYVCLDVWMYDVWRAGVWVYVCMCVLSGCMYV
jgi:hypothetical protein